MGRRPRTSATAPCGPPLADGRPFRAHNAKALMRSLLDLGIDLHALELDTAIAAYLLDPAETRYALGELLARYTPHTARHRRRSPRASSTSAAQAPTTHSGPPARRSPSTAWRRPLEHALEAQGMRKL